MSFEEDIQLKDLVAQTLETNGSLAKIRVINNNNFFNCQFDFFKYILGIVKIKYILYT